MSSLPLSKVCTKCGVEKPLAEFGRQQSRKDGHTSWCLVCRRRGKVLPTYADEKGEEWRAIPGYEGLYSVSLFGRVRRDARACATRPGLILRHNLSRSYPFVVLYKNRRPRTYTVHSLVAHAFIGERPDGHEVNHKDGVKTNPRSDNLEYCTKSENCKHALGTGLRTPAKGQESSQSKLTDTDVREIRFLKGKVPHKDLAAQFRVDRSVISRVQTGKSWAHIK